MLKTLCILFIAVSIASAATPVIGLLTIDATTSVESAAAWTWLQQQEGIKAELASLQNITALNPDLIFIHLASESEWTLLRSQDDAQTILVDYYKQGGKLLLTDYAALIPHWLGVESTAPVVDSVDIKDEETGRKYGFQSFRGHPLFNGFHGGVYLWHTNVDHQQARIGYFGDQWPSEGQAVGVEKAFIFLHQDDRLVIEYGPRRIISVGAFIHFSRPNYLREHTGLFLHNAINYLLHDVSGRKTTYWVNDENRARAFTIASTPPKPSKNRLLRHMPSTDLALRREPATENFYDVIGRRCIIMGKESGGIDEVWVHPFRAFYDIDVAIVQGDSLQWLRQWPCRFEARPEGIVRTYHSDTRVIREVIFAALHDHAGLIHIESDKPCKLIVRARGDLRWMWPYRQGSLGSIYYGYDDASGAFHLRDHSGDFYAILGADIQPSSHLLRACDSLLYRDNVLGGQGNLENQLLMAAVYDLNAENDYTLNIAFGAGDQGYADADRAYRSILQQPSRIYNEVVQHYENLFDNHTIVRSPDEHFNTGYLWKLVAIDRFWSTTPDLGTALLAGYGTTARGWDGGHKVNGRPGYAWYFGRDAVWSCFAVADYGDFPGVSRQLQFLARYQDISGKIFHEIATSGPVHYDASDATPLYVILAGHYLRASGDVALIKSLWPSLLSAMDFLYRTDTNGDGLIENTNVGHGWIEGGKLYGSHTELYLAALWAEALREAACMAKAIGEDVHANGFGEDADKIRLIINQDFYNDETGFYNLGLLSDGTYRTEPTVMPTVPMLFGLLDENRVAAMLKAYAGNTFSTDWGVRILSAESPLFNPRGYHYGSVWPLFTGWTALAEYRYGNSVQGFTHLMANLNIFKNWALGFSEEVSHGTVYRPGGVCSHQCWSETNALHPIISGMLGWQPDAVAGRAVLRPRMPLDWDWLKVERLCIGATKFSFEFSRQTDRSVYNFWIEEGPDLEIELQPEVPPGMTIEMVSVGGKKWTDFSRGQNGLLEPAVTFKLRKNISVEFQHHGGVGMVPFLPNPAPEDSSMGVRIIDQRLDGKTFKVCVEGRAGREGDFRLRAFTDEIDRADGLLLKMDEPGMYQLTVLFPAGDKAFVRKEVGVYLK